MSGPLGRGARATTCAGASQSGGRSGADSFNRSLHWQRPEVKPPTWLVDRRRIWRSAGRLVDWSTGRLADCQTGRLAERRWTRHERDADICTWIYLRGSSHPLARYASCAPAPPSIFSIACWAGFEQRQSFRARKSSGIFGFNMSAGQPNERQMQPREHSEPESAGKENSFVF